MWIKIIILHDVHRKIFNQSLRRILFGRGILQYCAIFYLELIYIFKSARNYKKQEMTSQSIYNQIIARVKKIYQTYQDRANQLAEDKRLKTGNKPDKLQQEFLRKLTEQQKFMAETVVQMKKQEKEYSSSLRVLSRYKKYSQKKALEFQNDTKISLDALRTDLRSIKETKMLCCGTDGIKKFKSPMNLFKVVAGKWRMLNLFQSKDGVQTYINPKFSQGDYQFIGNILQKQWPQQNKPIVQVKQVVKEVVVYRDREIAVPSGTVKPNPLSKANQSLYGINRQQNLTDGLEIYHQEAARGNPQACCFLGKTYEDGYYLPQDLLKSIEYYKKAINGKENYAFYRYALGLIKGKFSNVGQNKKDIQEGFNLLNQAANDPQNPCPEALTELGQIYEFGNFKLDEQRLFTVKKDINKAILYYNKARKFKLPRASNNLGVLYLNNKLNQKQGKSQVTSHGQNDKNIIPYLIEAQEAGFSQAFYNLGVIYSKGLLGQKNSQQALKMFYEGSLKGDYKCKIKFAYQLMNQTSVMKEQYQDHYNLAIQWLQSVARKFSRLQDHQKAPGTQILNRQRAEALFYLGLFHQHGFGVEKSPKKAIHYFIQSSGLDYPAAKNKIGDCYFSGYGLKQDRQLAVGCYIQSAQLGNSDAMVNLGTVYLNGIPNLVEKNYKKAYQNFYNATQHQNSDAMIHLSYMYKNGLGVEQNDEVARQLLEQAAHLKNSTALYMLKQQGIPFNQGILFQHLENEFFNSPKKIDLKQIVPVLATQYKIK